ncbi:GNAT family N-acetyltransferase [Marilutibacter chinensis]|uniref:GNAT family N-acetyltransferase n=1 Tax=Marilutibacter chinensis TaxID=2912247 RepID=A0ABS9HY19_9GAMM|nr:GNAT family protein [Lysobacter chinensis]MCF7223765.1 GNAT family N-acetyltransferase [Lysobacter chinensis]
MPTALPQRLQGKLVTLEKLELSHREPLRIAAEGDDAIWTYFPLNFNGAGEHFDEWFDYTMEQLENGRHYPFAVRRRSDDRIVGTTRYYDLISDHKRLAIGSTWYSKEVRGSLINSEVRLLTLGHAFDHLEMNRVEMITDPRNMNSRAAMRILGATQEGIMRCHLIYRDGRVRDSILFSIIRSDWPDVKARLHDRLAGTTRRPLP